MSLYLTLPVELSSMKLTSALSRSQVSRDFLTSSAAKSSATAANELMFATRQSESLKCVSLSSSNPVSKKSFFTTESVMTLQYLTLISYQGLFRIFFPSFSGLFDSRNGILVASLGQI